MKQLLNLQMSLFGSFENIGVSAPMAAELIPLFNNELIPSVIQLSMVDPSKNTIQNVNRLSMVSPDGSFGMVFLPDRIDCNYSAKEQVVELRCLNDLLFQMCKYLEAAVSHISAIGNRIAINGRYVTDEVSCVSNNYIKMPSFFAEKEIVEWTASNNAITTIEINGVNETVNNILNLSLARKESDNTVGVMAAFDINTVPMNTVPRFTSNSFADFLKQAIINIDAITAEV